jgi:hypothetical protein
VIGPKWYSSMTYQRWVLIDAFQQYVPLNPDLEFEGRSI